MTPKSPKRHGDLVGSAPGPLQPGDGIASSVVFEQKLDQCDDVGGFFSTRLRPPPERRVPLGRYILIEQLLASAGNGMRIQAEEIGQDGVAAVPQFDGLQPGEQATLLLVEQAVEKQNGCLEFIGRYLEGGGIGHQRNRLCGLPGTKLITSLPTIGGSV